jgi:hypothetical protein
MKRGYGARRAVAMRAPLDQLGENISYGPIRSIPGYGRLKSGSRNGSASAAPIAASLKEDSEFLFSLLLDTGHLLRATYAALRSWKFVDSSFGRSVRKKRFRWAGFNHLCLEHRHLRG